MTRFTALAAAALIAATASASAATDCQSFTTQVRSMLTSDGQFGNVGVVRLIAPGYSWMQWPCAGIAPTAHGEYPVTFTIEQNRVRLRVTTLPLCRTGFVDPTQCIMMTQ